MLHSRYLRNDVLPQLELVDGLAADLLRFTFEIVINRECSMKLDDLAHVRPERAPYLAQGKRYSAPPWV